MDKFSKALFLHFEKILLVVLGLGLLYSLVFYGPWMNRADFNEELAALDRDLDTKPVRGVEVIPDVPDLVASLEKAVGSIGGQEPLETAIVWNPPENKGVLFLPPSDVVAEGAKGHVAVTWEMNPNQVDPGESVKPIGVQVERATVVDSEVGEFVNLTVSAGGDYFTPAELYALVERYAPQTTPSRRRSGRSGAASRNRVTVDDLFNALHDDLITMADIRTEARNQVRAGNMTAENQMYVAEVIRILPQAAQMIQREMRGEGVQLSREDVLKRALEDLGYRGNGRWRPGGTVVTTAEDTERKAPKKVVVNFDDVTTFVDADISPDQEYVYRVRFWTEEMTGLKPEKKQTIWVNTQIVAAKPDTEFFLTGISPDTGTASILVKKWLPSTEEWISRSYQVSPGEQIGRVEMIQRLSADGTPVVDAAGNAEMQAIDFSTECVLLAFRYRPRSFEQSVTVTEIDAETGQKRAVDKVQQLLYDTPQIVYSDRKGKLRLKWRNLVAT